MVHQTANWDETKMLLREARSLLPEDAKTNVTSGVPVGVLKGTLAEFEEFLEHNELELAWDALAAMAHRVQGSPACWEKLARAAHLMMLPEKEISASRQVSLLLTSDQVLAVARLDAEKAYRDLTPYRIVLVLEADGWHVDYELKNPNLIGGGPHYLIDPLSGKILSKRYEQ